MSTLLQDLRFAFRSLRKSPLVDFSGDTVSYPWYREVRESTSSSLSGLAAWRTRDISLSGGAAAERILGGVVFGNYFDVLGARSCFSAPSAPHISRRAALRASTR